MTPSDSSELVELGADRELVAGRSTADRVAEVLRTRIAEGYFMPGTQLPEEGIRGALGISRNSLREAFRLLGREGLVKHALNRGVFVRVPSLTDLEDIYRVRRTLEGAGVAAVREPGHRLGSLEQAVADGRRAIEEQDWQELGTANIHFHQGIVALLGSARLDELMANVTAELRLVFHRMPDPRELHEPYLPRNIELLELLRSGNGAAAGEMLDAYLNDALNQFVHLYGRLLQEDAR